MGDRETERQSGVRREEQRQKQGKGKGTQREGRRKGNMKKTDTEQKKPGELCPET